MAQTLTGVTCGDGYTSAATLQNAWNARGGWFTTAGQGVIYQLQYGKQGFPYWTFEQSLPAGSSGSMDQHCTGIRFRNATAGQNATVSAYIAEGDEPPLNVTIGSGTASAAGYAVLGQGQVLGTHGTATTLGSLSCSSVSVHANAANTGLVYLGKSTVTTANGYKMSAGDAVAFLVANISGVFFDVDNTNDGVSWIAVG